MLCCNPSLCHLKPPWVLYNCKNDSKCWENGQLYDQHYLKTFQLKTKNKRKTPKTLTPNLTFFPSGHLFMGHDSKTLISYGFQWGRYCILKLHFTQKEIFLALFYASPNAGYFANWTRVICLWGMFLTSPRTKWANLLN